MIAPTAVKVCISHDYVDIHLPPPFTVGATMYYHLADCLGAGVRLGYVLCYIFQWDGDSPVGTEEIEKTSIEIRIVRESLEC